MQVKKIGFGSVTIDGQTYHEDIVIDGGKILFREKERSRKWKGRFGHTPLSADENIPWHCRRLIIGNGMYGRLPVMDEVKRAAVGKGVQLQIMLTPQAVRHVNDPETNFVLHLTC